MAGNPKFGKRIRDLREAKKKTDPSFSLRQFATAVGISATFLSKIENGDFDPPASDKIIKMAELLDVNADELLGLADKHDPELDEIIQSKPVVMADFLRKAHAGELTPSDMKKFQEALKKKKPGGKKK